MTDLEAIQSLLAETVGANQEEEIITEGQENKRVVKEPYAAVGCGDIATVRALVT